MPDRADPKGGLVTYPRFLDGKAPPPGAGDRERRQALADSLTAVDNYWFSAAYVNRVCNELFGQSFYERVDDLSPKSEVVFPAVASRLAAAFRGSGYDTRGLMRALVNSQAYQRQVRLGEATDEHLRFAAVYPTRLRAEVLWQTLTGVLGRMPNTPFAFQAFKAEFDFDPSLKADEIHGSIPQALWLLNSPLVHDRIKVQDLRVPPAAKGPKGPAKVTAEPTFLKQLLTRHAHDDSGALRALYRHTLARNPTDRELETCLAYIQETKREAGTRAEAFEDLFKALINTAEFQRKR
jgi:hypothetical protein